VRFQETSHPEHTHRCVPPTSGRVVSDNRVDDVSCAHVAIGVHFPSSAVAVARKLDRAGNTHPLGVGLAALAIRVVGLGIQSAVMV
jgi:hypothetical protein